MIDKIDISCKCKIKDFKKIYEYCSFKDFRVKSGSGRKFFKEKSLMTNYFQIYFTQDLDDVEIYSSIGSEYSNKFGMYLLKKLLSFGLYDIKIVRIDFCYDMYGDDVKDWKIVPIVVNKKPNMAKPMPKIIRNPDNNKFINTTYIISNSFKIRMYDKGVEQHLEPFNSNWKRFEVELRRDLIFNYVGTDYLTFNNGTVKEYEMIYRALIKYIYERYEFNRKYQRILKKLINKGDERLNRQYVKNDLERTMAWFERTYKEYIKMHVATNPDDFKEIVNNPVKQAEAINNFYEYWSSRG